MGGYVNFVRIGKKSHGMVRSCMTIYMDTLLGEVMLSCNISVYDPIFHRNNR